MRDRMGSVSAGFQVLYSSVSLVYEFITARNGKRQPDGVKRGLKKLGRWLMADCKLTKNDGGWWFTARHSPPLSTFCRDRPRLIAKGINLWRKRSSDQRRTMVLMKSDEMNGGPTCSLSRDLSRVSS